MRVLVVAATAPEAGPIQAARIGRDIDVLVTGVGMVATAAQTSRALAQTRYNLALNFGVCGSFDPALRPGSVVHVVRDRIAELGAEDGDAFLPFETLQLPGDAFFVNAAPPANAALNALPVVTAITVNTVHGSQRSIASVTQRFAPQVESMEGAAFMYACLINGVPFAQVRAVSNIVERRNREAWNLGEAIENLGRAASSILRCL
ncbi:MAG TPA: futalosine hydrolase [Vicinamibacterales bacterium]|nr:futalosine hydrolase [Vicinamibacterales bacterium]